MADQSLKSSLSDFKADRLSPVAYCLLRKRNHWLGRHKTPTHRKESLLTSTAGKEINIYMAGVSSLTHIVFIRLSDLEQVNALLKPQFLYL